MKKSICAVIAVICIVVLTLAACGSGSGGGKAETVEVGAFSVTVPAGWTAFPQTDILGEKDENGNYPIDPETIFIAKDASSEFDAYSKANIRIYWYDPDSVVLDLKSIYEDVEDLTGVQVNGVECTAFAGTSMGYRYEFIHYQTEEAQYDFNILVSYNGEPTGVTWEDPDIKAIMESAVAN